jgi:hypothetical protein
MVIVPEERFGFVIVGDTSQEASRCHVIGRAIRHAKRSGENVAGIHGMHDLTASKGTTND